GKEAAASARSRSGGRRGDQPRLDPTRTKGNLMPEAVTINADAPKEGSRWSYAQDPFLERVRMTLEDMVLYHNCNHPMLVRDCCCCEAKRLVREIEDRQGKV